MLRGMETHTAKKGRPRKARPLAQMLPEDEKARHQQSIGLRIREQRERLGWSTVDLAQRAGVTPTLVQGLEHGKNSPLTWTMVLLARALGCSAGWLAFGG